MLPESITLTAAWNDVPAGTVFRVLTPGENPAPGVVDPRRAAQLLADALAVPSDQAATVPATGKRKGVRGG